VKFTELLDATTASALQVAWLSEALAPVSEPGRRADAAIEPFRPGQENEAQARSRNIVEWSAFLDAQRIDAMRDALRTAPDPLPAISRAAMGDTLDDAQFLELQRFLDAVLRIDTLLNAPSRAFVKEATAGVISALEKGRAGKFGFYLADTFDTTLAAARAAAERAQAEYDSARGRLAQSVAAQLGRDELPGDEFIVMRDTVERIPQGVRVVREAPTYYLCELELDEAALEALRKRDAANERVAAAEESVRSRLSAAVREHAQALEDLTQRIGEFDVVLALARFTQRFGCVPARIGHEQTLSFKDARYLPLQGQLEAQGQRYEPISIDLNDVAVLTGPNMGGKSVALRTCGFIAALAAFGVPVPASFAATCLFDEIAWLGIGVQEELGGLLSSFAREVVRLKALLERRSVRMLVLVDEFARTTTPHEGKALLVALIRTLQRRGRLAFIATHLAGIAAHAGVRHFAVRGLRNVPRTHAADLHAALAALADSMDYAIVEVGDGAQRQADAIALAHLLGLDDDLVAEAGVVLAEET
jgi:DNA mismatch repair protein MutS2